MGDYGTLSKWETRCFAVRHTGLGYELKGKHELRGWLYRATEGVAWNH